MSSSRNAYLEQIREKKIKEAEKELALLRTYNLEFFAGNFYTPKHAHRKVNASVKEAFADAWHQAVDREEIVCLQLSIGGAETIKVHPSPDADTQYNEWTSRLPVPCY